MDKNFLFRLRHHFAFFVQFLVLVQGTVVIESKTTEGNVNFC